MLADQFPFRHPHTPLLRAAPASPPHNAGGSLLGSGAAAAAAAEPRRLGFLLGRLRVLLALPIVLHGKERQTWMLATMTPMVGISFGWTCRNEFERLAGRATER